ncbi:MAG: CHASE2 domain-containing protein [Coleofasciculus sp. S288]|nr:CHASE2 domain-containing protein [Coleofasciculus sp. S288]
MKPRTVFRLNVLPTDRVCLFQLRWGEEAECWGKLDYPDKVIDYYDAWRERYIRLDSTLRARELSSGGMTPSTGDLSHEVEEAKEAFLDAFQRWLSPLREIRETIQHQIYSAAQKRSHSKEIAESYQPIDIFVACDSEELTRLPWEAWELVPEGVPKDTIRIARIPLTTRQNSKQLPNKLLPGKPRILVILGDNTDLDLERDKQAVKRLKRVAKVEFFDWQQKQELGNLKAELAKQIADERGWAALFFMGHSDETTITGGELAIAPNCFLSISDLKEYITTAKKQGLQFCLFNSCSGLKIADRLADLGLQVVVMREPIHDEVAHVFLEHFCKQLAQHNDVHDAMLKACHHLQTAEKFAFPSAYLIPSFFSSLGAIPFCIEPFGWKRRLQQWLPTKREAIALAALLLLGVLSPVRSGLFELRTGIQALYRDKTNQFPQLVLAPVLLIAIDPQSLKEENIDTYKVHPMDRAYLAKLVNKLSQLDARVIGVDYLLDGSAPEDQVLAESIHTAVKQQGTWFVFANREDEAKVRLEVTDKIASYKWSLQGDMTLTYYPFWEVMLPARGSCEEGCPLAYVLALAQALRQETRSVNVPRPQWNNSTDFQSQVVEYFNRSNEQDNTAIVSLKQAFPPLGLQPLLDFSIPPTQVYNRLSAWRFLELPPDAPEFKNLNQQVVIIAPGGYDRAEDNFSVPLAVSYWRSNREKQEMARQWLTGGEAHAYIIHHLLSQHRVVLIPDAWMIVAAAILGKGAKLILLKQKRQQRQQMALALAGGTLTGGLVGLQIYTWASFSIPWFLPSIMFWIYVLSVLRRKPYG